MKQRSKTQANEMNGACFPFSFMLPLTHSLHYNEKRKRTHHNFLLLFMFRSCFCSLFVLLQWSERNEQKREENKRDNTRTQKTQIFNWLFHAFHSFLSLICKKPIKIRSFSMSPGVSCCRLGV